MGRKERQAKKDPVSAKVSKKAEAMEKKARLNEGEKKERLAVLDTAVITGNCTSHRTSRDILMENVSIALHGTQLLQDTKLELIYGRRYGVLGANGCGKSTLLAALAARELPVPDHIDVWHLHEEAAPSDKTAVQSVVDVVALEYNRLEKLLDDLIEEDPEKNCEMIDQIGEKLERFDPNTFESRACELLFGLGFTQVMMAKQTKDMSGGWRMRVALAQALFVNPSLLLLDEPTNHLDLGACVWLEETLAKMEGCLVVISHSQDFLNGVCTNIMQFDQNNRLEVWAGNYDSYIQTRTEKERNQMTKWKKENDDIEHIKKFIASCGTYANLQKQAASKQKIIDKMTEAGLTEKPKADPVYEFYFPDSGKLAPPVCAFDDVSFSYSGKPEDYLYSGLSFGIDCESRIALLGPNGAGKSTLIKLICEDITPCKGQVKKHSHLRIGRYNQHSAEVLPMDQTPIEFMQRTFVEGLNTENGKKVLSLDEWRGKLGKFGISGDLQTRKIGTMSHGLQTRVVFALIALGNPHLLLLDEPTNHLDMGCIDSLASAIKEYSGGLLLVSHDYRLINKVAKEIWICDDKKVEPWKLELADYKKHLQKLNSKTAKLNAAKTAAAAKAKAAAKDKLAAKK